MTDTFLVFSNLIMPLISGLFFLFYFAYFLFAHPSRALSFRLFVVFLIAFSVFLFGRPLQLLLGPHPMPLIVVNIRVFILCSVLAPVIILTALTYHRRLTQREMILIFAICLPLGLAYVVFNSLGTKASYRLFEFLGVVAYDNLTPNLQAPFYGREVTIGVQTITGLILAFFSFIRLLQQKREDQPKKILSDKVFLINAGILVFAASFILGSLAKQWWVYYVASVLSALFIGGSVLIDIKELHNYYEKLVPFIKEEIIHNVAFSELSKSRLIEMLTCLGKKADLNTFVLLKAKPGAGGISSDIAAMDAVVQALGQRLEAELSEDSYLILPMSDDTVGVALRLPRAKEEGRPDILGALDDIREKIDVAHKRGLAAGIGRSYDKIEELRNSYHEAAKALEFAEQLDGCGVVHVENISEPDRRVGAYPVLEKERLLSLIRSGDAANAVEAARAFFAKFLRYIEEEPAVIRIRLYELVCSFADSAILGGGDEKALNALAAKRLAEIDHLADPALAERWLLDIARETAQIVAKVYEKRSKVLIENAKKYIETHYSSQLSYRDVAREVFISPSYFLALFKRETGVTFVDYLTSVRIERAKNLLLSTDLSITHIAYDVGFSNSNYFSNLFRKAVGVSASEFRRNRETSLPASE